MARSDFFEVLLKCAVEWDATGVQNTGQPLIPADQHQQFIQQRLVVMFFQCSPGVVIDQTVGNKTITGTYDQLLTLAPALRLCSVRNAAYFISGQAGTQTDIYVLPPLVARAAQPGNAQNRQFILYAT